MTGAWPLSHFAAGMERGDDGRWETCSRVTGAWPLSHPGSRGALSEKELFLACRHGIAYLDVATLIAAVEHETAPGAVHAALGKLEE